MEKNEKKECLERFCWAVQRDTFSPVGRLVQGRHQVVGFVQLGFGYWLNE
jgi:hypothetical protein